MAPCHLSTNMRRWTTVVLILSFICLISASKQKLEVRKHLRRLNKPAVKTIKSSDGDLIDCIRMSHQPAFDHPLLKNHTIQLRPNYHPEGLYDVSKVSVKPKERSITQLWHGGGRCPKGTIPVRRTKEDDLYRASSVKRYGRKKHKAVPQPKSAEPDLIYQNGHQHAIAYVEGDKYYGAKATINVWEPKIQQPNEFSLSQIWLLGGSFGQDLNSIEAGWQVIKWTPIFDVRVPASRLVLICMAITTPDCSLTGLVTPTKPLDATTFCARGLFKSAMK